LFKGIRRAIKWLADGLVQAWTDVEEQLRPRQRLQFVRTNEGYVPQRPDGEALAERLPLDDASAEVPDKVRAFAKNSDIDVVLPADELLIRTLEPLPAQSRPYLDGIVRHQLERLTPWRVSDVLYTYQVAPAGAEDSRLIVTLAATARSLHRRLLERLAELQPRNVRLVYDQAYAGKDIVISVTGNAGNLAREQKIRRRIGWGAAALGAGSLAAIVLLTMAWQSTDATLEAVERDVANLRAKLAARGPTVPAGDRDVAAMLTRRLNSPVSVLAVDALSESLPDDTYLTELRISEGRVRVTGVSRSVSRLVPLLEASPSFAEPTFFAPTTRLPNNQGDRFHLDARIVPPGTPKP
jgi:general secretion pathway protein L